MRQLARYLSAVLLLCLTVQPVAANNTAQTLPFSQNWTNAALITANDNWSGVPGIEGFRGDGLTAATGTDPRTILAGDDPGVLDVNANQTNPVTFSTGGVTEFAIADPVVALTGSGTADAPYLKLYLNTTGQTGVTVSYKVRDIEAGTDDAVQQVALHYRVGGSGNFADVPAAYIADATTGTTATQVTDVCVVLPTAADNQSLVQLRIMTTNAVGNDEWIGIDDIVINTAGCGGPPLPNLSINDVPLAEGDAGTTTFTFTVSLSAPAGPGGVTFDIATADNTATTADNDYVAQSLTGQTIPAGSSTYAFNVLVNGDMTAEANQTFFVNVTSVTGANVTDGQGTGTISNDDVTVTPIHDIQGPGNSSPIVGATVTTRGVVTGIKNNGFFIQEPDATVDADPATSEGVFVFTSAAPPASAAVGNYVQVTATVVEFVPPQDPLQPPLTELSSPAVVLLSTPPTAPPLPTAVTLNGSFPDPAGPVDQLERVEGMRVAVASLTVVGPTMGNVNEPNATATSTGVFFGVVTGNARPFREPGIQAPDPAPAGSSIPPVPRWDANPELLRVDSDAIGAPVLNVGTGAVVTNLAGPLDYTFRRYTILPEPATPFAAAGGPTPVAATVPTSQEFTVASFNVERFFDTVNDPAIGEPVLTAAAYQGRLEKASRIIRDYLRTPDVLGVVEVENLNALQDLADQINADAGGANPQYTAFLVEGNDVGGIDVGFLVKTAPVAGATPRVEVVEVQQELDGTLIVNPDSSTETLNDRPPLRLNAIIHHANGASFPVTVIVNHMRSLNDVESIDPGPNGWPTLGARVRNKRQKQAEDLANLVQARQAANPSERIILIGDFNAFEFNDGFTDSMGTIEGTPVPDNETAVPGDGVDLVNPDLDNLFDTAPPAERYSFIFDGNAQSLDHVVVNEDVIDATVARRLEHPRVNADFPQVFRNDATSSTRLADHDPLVAYFQVAEFATAGVSITKGESADPVVAGSNLTYTLTVTNGGPDAATALEVTDALPAGTTFVSVTATGWSCTTPAVGANGTVTCTLPTLAAGPSATIEIVVQVDPALAADTVLTNTATVTADSGDLDSSDNTATITTQANATSDYSLTLTDAPDPVMAGANLTYTLTVTNAGPGAAQTVSFNDPLPAGTTFQSLSQPGGWSCSTPAVGASGTVSCSIATLGAGSAVFTMTVQVGAFVPGGTTLTNTASLSSATPDSVAGDTMAAATTLVSSPAAFAGTKTRTGGTLQPGGTVTYTIVLTNNGSAAQGDNPGDELTDVLPSSLILVSASATAGTAVANVGTNTVTWNGALGAGGSVTITIQATIRADVAPGTVISNQATFSYDADGNGTNEASGATDDPGAGGAADPTTFTVAEAFTPEIPTLGEWAMLLMALLLAVGGALTLRRGA